MWTELYRWPDARSHATSRNTNSWTAFQRSCQSVAVLPSGLPPRKPRERKKSCSTRSPLWLQSSEALLDSSLDSLSCQFGKSWENISGNTRRINEYIFCNFSCFPVSYFCCNFVIKWALFWIYIWDILNVAVWSITRMCTAIHFFSLLTFFVCYLIVVWFSVWTKKLLELISFNFCNSNYQDLIKSSYKCWLPNTKHPFGLYSRMIFDNNNMDILRHNGDNEWFVLWFLKMSWFSWMINTTKALKIDLKQNITEYALYRNRCFFCHQFTYILYYPK